MSNDHLPTRRTVLAGAVGLATGGLYPLSLHAYASDASDTQQANAPYRYAGKKWWLGEMPIASVVRQDLMPVTGEERGFEHYHSVRYIRKPGEPTLLPTRESGDKVPFTYILLSKQDAEGRAYTESVLYLAEVLNRWAQDMTSWAKAVREDLLALEAAIGKKDGDPGDPPPVPWK